MSCNRLHYCLKSLQSLLLFMYLTSQLRYLPLKNTFLQKKIYFFFSKQISYNRIFRMPYQNRRSFYRNLTQGFERNSQTILKPNRKSYFLQENYLSELIPEGNTLSNRNYIIPVGFFYNILWDSQYLLYGNYFSFGNYCFSYEILIFESEYLTRQVRHTYTKVVNTCIYSPDKG